MRIPPPAELAVAIAFIALMAGTGWLVDRSAPAGPRLDASVDPDLELAARFTATCLRGEPAGCANLGVLYATGRGAPHDESVAASLYQRACSAGHARACSNLGVLYAQGRGVARDDSLAAALFRRACVAGEAAACENLKRLRPPGAPPR